MKKPRGSFRSRLWLHRTNTMLGDQRKSLRGATTTAWRKRRKARAPRDVEFVLGLACGAQRDAQVDRPRVGRPTAAARILGVVTTTRAWAMRRKVAPTRVGVATRVLARAAAETRAAVTRRHAVARPSAVLASKAPQTRAMNTQHRSARRVVRAHETRSHAVHGELTPAASTDRRRVRRVALILVVTMGRQRVRRVALTRVVRIRRSLARHVALTHAASTGHERASLVALTRAVSMEGSLLGRVVSLRHRARPVALTRVVSMARKRARRVARIRRSLARHVALTHAASTAHERGRRAVLTRATNMDRSLARSVLTMPETSRGRARAKCVALIHATNTVRSRARCVAPIPGSSARVAAATQNRRDREQQNPSSRAPRSHSSASADQRGEVGRFG